MTTRQQDGWLLDVPGGLIAALPHLSEPAVFQKALAQRPYCRSAYFSLSHATVALADVLGQRRPGPQQPELSTGMPADAKPLVDECCAAALPAASGVAPGRAPVQPGAGARASAWVGVVVAKRLARRAVTRSLIRRQAYQALASWVWGWRQAVPSATAGVVDRAEVMDRATTALVPQADVWIVRLTRSFDRKLFPSAASNGLRLAVRADLTDLLHKAQARLAAGSAGTTNPTGAARAGGT